MAKWQTLLISSSLLAIGLVASLIFTNPSAAAYEDYVIEEVRRRAQQECSRASANTIGAVVANITCQKMMAAGHPYLRNLLKPLIADRTTRHNWGIASIYHTQIDVDELNFKGQIESIGILDRFYTYQMP
jgi:Domain of unknown function (DUF4359)